MTIYFKADKVEKPVETDLLHEVNKIKVDTAGGDN